MDIHSAIEQDIWNWLHDFVSTDSEFYDFNFPPCPFARAALVKNQVDVVVWHSGEPRRLIREGALGMRDAEELATRVIAFPPRTQFAWGLSEFVETLNAELIPDNIFLNTGIAKTTSSRYPGAADPYFIAVVNTLDAVLRGSDALQRSDYYKDWPADHYRLVVERRSKLAARYGQA